VPGRACRPAGGCLRNTKNMKLAKKGTPVGRFGTPLAGHRQLVSPVMNHSVASTPQHVLTFRGHRVAYERAGNGAPLLFLHNGGTSRRIWRPQMEHFASTHSVYAMDLLGYGDSAKPHVEYALPLYVSLLEEFIEQLGPERVTLVGNCMGSAMALAFARQKPERVQALVLINTLTEQTVSAGVFGGLYRLNARSGLVRTLLQAASSRIRIPRTATANAIKGQLGRNGRRAGIHRDPVLQELYQSRDQLRVLNVLLRNLQSYRELDRLSAADVRVPVCSIWGTENRVLPAAAGRILCGRLAPCQAEWLEGCGHLPMIEQPEAVNRIISRFLGIQVM
jgi:pimeloyl-ACP methyl ester carboxylesterase